MVALPTGRADRRALLRGFARADLTHTLANDNVTNELLRAQAWLRKDPSLVITGKPENLKGIPDGWPDTVPNPAEHLEEWRTTRVNAAMEKMFNADKPTRDENQANSPSVKRLAAIVGSLNGSGV